MADLFNDGDPFGEVRLIKRVGVSVAPELPRDCDGIPIPQFFQGNVARWEGLPKSWRERQSAAEIERLSKVKPEPQKRSGGTNYTTQYAIKWGRRQGWTLVDRESYDHRTKRLRDLMLGVDVLFDDGNGLVGVQGAGRYERAEHYERFLSRGGVEKARRRHVRVVYVEFVRGDFEPALIEEWA